VSAVGSYLGNPDNYALNIHALPTFVTSLAIAVLGLFVVVRERGSRISILFLATTLTIMVWQFAFSWMYCATDGQVAFIWAKIAYLSVPLIPAVICHFTVVVLGVSQRTKALVWTGWIGSLSFLVGDLVTNGLIDGVYRQWWGFYPKYSWLGLPFLAFFFYMMVASLYLYWTEYWRAKPGQRKTRIRMLFISFAIAYLGSVDFQVQQGHIVYPFGFIPIFAFVVVTAWTIWRYRLVDLTPSFAAAQILSTMDGAVLVADVDGHIRVANRAASALLGYRSSELSDMSVASIIRPAGEGRGDESGGARREGFRNRVMRWPTKAGRDVDVRVSAAAILDQDQRPAGMVYVALDISELRQAQDALRTAYDSLELKVQERTAELAHANAELNKLDQMKSDFIATVSHELRTPLTAIKNAVDLLVNKEAGPLTNHQDRFLNIAARNIRRLSTMINDILDFSKIEAGKLELRFAEVHLAGVIKQVLATYQAQAQTGAVRLQMECDQDMPAVYGDPDRLEQVMGNLVGNALKFTPKGGQITLTAHRDHESIEVRVADTGVGIAPAHQVHLFERFYQVGDSLTKSTVGSGLGLAIVKELVEAHGGAIRVESEVDKGSTFIFTLQASSSPMVRAIAVDSRLRRLPPDVAHSVLVVTFRNGAGVSPGTLEALCEGLRAVTTRGRDELIPLPALQTVVIMLPETPKAGAVAVRKKIDQALSDPQGTLAGILNSSVTVRGPATCPDDGETGLQLIRAAEQFH
jgi:PAS domain S-box-containing protein